MEMMVGRWALDERNHPGWDAGRVESVAGRRAADEDGNLCRIGVASKKVGGQEDWRLVATRWLARSTTVGKKRELGEVGRAGQVSESNCRERGGRSGLDLGVVDGAHREVVEFSTTGPSGCGSPDLFAELPP